MFTRIPTAFLPDEDQGVLFAQVQTPPGSSSSNYTTLEEHVRRLLEVLEAYEEARPAIRDEALARRLEQLGERVELAFVKEDVAV
ncbi:efflux RND transporter permease subunit, partial [Escherichia coli]|uniref:efflux RND transporter permease subunit n=1 Tax=Escherichia coli TaxID=562 RepID=UPI00390C6968